MSKIKCLDCGKYFTRPCVHVWQVHKISAREYKQRHGLDVGRGILPEKEREIMRQHVKNNGTIENLKRGSKHRFKKNQKGLGKYQRSEQTIERLKANWIKVSALGLEKLKQQRLKGR